MKTKIIKVKGDWEEILNDCRHTVGKEELNKEPSDNFKKSILIAEHSPIRDLSIKWLWERIPHWVGVHWVRHKWECLVETQRTDRTSKHIPRGKLSQDEPQNFKGEMNIQHSIDTSRKRLCYQASPETRAYAEDFKITVHEEVDKLIADVLVPNCVYRGGCPEQMMCPEHFWLKFLEYCNENHLKLNTIQQRYDAYNKMFYETRKYTKDTKDTE